MAWLNCANAKDGKHHDPQVVGPIGRLQVVCPCGRKGPLWPDTKKAVASWINGETEK